MDPNELLIRHAATWATSKNRPLDREILSELLDLRGAYTDLPPGAWPTGSVRDLLLVTWPAYGPSLPDLDSLRDTIDTFLGFLRATGRMSTESAQPAELRKETKKALPRMTEAYHDPANHSQGRVLREFGAEIGVDLESAPDLDTAQERLNQIQEAWNSLPQEERIARMPDPSPKSARGQSLTAALDAALEETSEEEEEEEEEEDFDDAIPPLRPGDPAVSARQARESGFLQACLALADWVGSGREVTATGLLRPAVARDAYRALDLWPWDRALDAVVHGGIGHHPDDLLPEVEQVHAELALTGWRSAGDCIALDRLWGPCVSAGLVDVGSRRAERSEARPETDEEWRELAILTLLGLVLRLGEWVVEPLVPVLLVAHAADGPAPIAAARDVWDTACPQQLRVLGVDFWQKRLDLMLFHVDDCGIVRSTGDTYELTDLGRDFLNVYLGVLESGLLEDYSS